MPVNTGLLPPREGGTFFYFEILEPASTSGERVYFPAYIRSISDSFSPGWGKYNDMGRADPKTMYESFDRSIQISFQTVALDSQEDEAIFEKLNILSKAAHPHYISGRGYVGRYVLFTVGEMYVDEYGYIDSLQVQVDPTSHSWSTREISSDFESGTYARKPLITDVDITIGWIGKQRPDAGRSKSYYTEI